MIDHLVLNELGGLFYLPQKYFFNFFQFIPPSKRPSFLHYGEKEICVLFSERRNFMKHKLKISPDVKVKDLIGESNKVTIIVPGDSVKSVTIEETKEEPNGK